MQDDLLALQGKPISSVTVEVKTLASFSSDISKCRILYLSAKVAQNFDLNVLSENGIMTVGDSGQFLKNGGGIAIIREGNRLVFSINMKALSKAQIKPSSKILRLAREIR